MFGKLKRLFKNDYKADRLGFYLDNCESCLDPVMILILRNKNINLSIYMDLGNNIEDLREISDNLLKNIEILESEFDHIKSLNSEELFNKTNYIKVI